jgi:hypothetical protein
MNRPNWSKDHLSSKRVSTFLAKGVSAVAAPPASLIADATYAKIYIISLCAEGRQCSGKDRVGDCTKEWVKETNQDLRIACGLTKWASLRSNGEERGEDITTGPPGSTRKEMSILSERVSFGGRELRQVDILIHLANNKTALNMTHCSHSKHTHHTLGISPEGLSVL